MVANQSLTVRSDATLAKPHYIVRRSRCGRFNFTLITGLGRIIGYVEVETVGKTTADIRQEAHRKIRCVADEFLNIANRGEREAEPESVDGWTVLGQHRPDTDRISQEGF